MCYSRMVQHGVIKSDKQKVYTIGVWWKDAKMRTPTSFLLLRILSLNAQTDLQCKKWSTYIYIFLWCFLLDMQKIGLIGIKAFTGKTLNWFLSMQNRWTVKWISLGPKDICLGFHDKEATRILMFMSESFYYVLRKLLYLVFVCHFISTLQIFAPNPAWFYLCILCVPTYTWCCNIAHQHAQ